MISVLMGLGVGILVLTALLPSENPGDLAVDTKDRKSGSAGMP